MGRHRHLRGAGRRCFVLFSNIVGVGYRKLDDGQEVVFTFEDPGFKQDGYDFSALQVWSS